MDLTKPDPDQPPARPGRSEPLGGRAGATVVMLAPFLSVALFLIFRFPGHWVFFLLTPIAGVIVYGGAGSWLSGRDRTERRQRRERR